MEGAQKNSSEKIFLLVRESLAAARKVFAPNETEFAIVVALSGGKDSCVLLDVLQSLSGQLSLRLVAAHFDHALREESFQESRVVEKICAAHQIPFHCERATEEGKLHEVPAGENLEAWARKRRYEFLERVRMLTGADAIVTAHHEQDQAETLLLRLFSGRLLTSRHSAAAIDSARQLFRPLLKCPKEYIDNYQAERRLLFVEDSSNADRSRLRNRLRHEALPELTKNFNPALVATLAELAEQLSEDEVQLWRFADQELSKLPDHSIASLRTLPFALRHRALAILLRAELGESASRVGFRALSEVATYLESPQASQKTFELGFGIRCTMSAIEKIRFYVETEQPSVSNLQPERLHIPGTVCRCYNDGSNASISARLIPVSDIIDVSSRTEGQSLDAGESPAFEYFNADELLLDVLLVRERREGDEMRVWRRGSRKLKKLFCERRLRLTLRDRVPIVELGGRILWIPGVARSEIAPVTSTSMRVVELRYRRN